VKKDYYAILGVSRKASARELERAYIKLARRLHPDVNPGDRRAAAEFRRIKEAWRVLSDEKARRRYDRTGEEPAPPAEKSGHGEQSPLTGDLRSWENIFRDIFQDDRPRETGEAAVPGEDIHKVLEITFEESLVRTRKQVTYQRDAVCSRCSGTRYEPGAGVRACPDCGGSGLVEMQRGPYRAQKLCHLCEGSGETGDRPCAACRGKGRTLKTEHRNVTVPPGSDSGTLITVPAGGQPGKGGARSGNLVLTIRVAPHPDLERKGFNLYTSIPITVAEAALGATLFVLAAGTRVSLKIPPGTQSGQQFCVHGKGVPRGKGKAGDLFVTVQAVIPAARDGQARKLFREIEKVFPDNPRVSGKVKA
jgi:molecular chaperone DnaJ